MARKKRRRKKSSGRYLSPGVHVEEVSSGSRPIEGVGTSIAGFIGFVGGSRSCGAGWLSPRRQWSSLYVRALRR